MPVIVFNASQGFKLLKLWRKLGGSSIMITILRGYQCPERPDYSTIVI